MPDRHTATRPGRLAWHSLAELFEQYENLFLQGHNYRHTFNSSCGLQVTAFDRCFPHLVGLTRVDQGLVSSSIYKRKNSVFGRI